MVCLPAPAVAEQAANADISIALCLNYNDS